MKSVLLLLASVAAGVIACIAGFRADAPTTRWICFGAACFAGVEAFASLRALWRAVQDASAACDAYEENDDCCAALGVSNKP